MINLTNYNNKVHLLWMTYKTRLNNIKESMKLYKNS